MKFVDSIIEFYKMLDIVEDEVEFKMWAGIFSNLKFVKDCPFLEGAKKEKLKIIIEKIRIFPKYKSVSYEDAYAVVYIGNGFYTDKIIQKDEQGEWNEIFYNNYNL